MKTSKAALRTRLAAMGAPNGKNVGGRSDDMDASTPVLGKRPRTMGETKETGIAAGGNSEKRPCSEALETAIAANLEAVRGHAHW